MNLQLVVLQVRENFNARLGARWRFATSNQFCSDSPRTQIDGKLRHFYFPRIMDVEAASNKLREILARADKLGIPKHRLRTKLQLLGGLPAADKRTRAACNFLAGVLSVTVALAYCIGLHTHDGFSRAWLKWHRNTLYEDKVSENFLSICFHSY